MEIRVDIDVAEEMRKRASEATAIYQQQLIEAGQKRLSAGAGQLDPLDGRSGDAKVGKQECPECKGRGIKPKWPGCRWDATCRKCKGTGAIATSPIVRISHGASNE